MGPGVRIKNRDLDLDPKQQPRYQQPAGDAATTASLNPSDQPYFGISHMDAVSLIQSVWALTCLPQLILFFQNGWGSLSGASV